MKSIIIFMIFFLLCLCATAFATQFDSIVVCPVAGELGQIKFTVRSAGNPANDRMLIATNVESREIAFINGVDRVFYFDAFCESSLNARLSASYSYAGAMTVLTSWVPAVIPADVSGNKQIVSLMVGALTGIAFSLAVSKGVS
ncbi:MAG: hypothetical protein HZB31_06095 [Nitrospirae bacterium]|nr:hypothetical protein [Nitrospirota bacterium]